MKTVLPFILLSALLCGRVRAADNSLPTPINLLKAQASEIAHSLEAAELWIGGTVIVSNGTATNVGLYGIRGPADNGALSGTSHFEIGSISKSFTGILLAYLVNQNSSIHLDDPIENFVPELKGHFSGGITLRQLGNQVSGLTGDFCINEGTPSQKCYFNPADPANPWADFTESELLDYLKDFPSPGPGPHPYVYSNPGFITLGYVLTRITQKPYDELLKTVITDPLNMNDTLVNKPGATVSDYIQGYNVIQLPQKHWQFDVLSAPTGGIVSTPNDMAKYLSANLSPPQSLLGQAILTSQKNGLGWDSSPGDAVIWKNGGTYGFSSYIMIDPAHQAGWLALSNLASDYSGDYFPNYTIFGGVRPDIFGITLSDQALESFVGNYICPSFPGSIAITKPGHFLRFDGGENDSDFRLQALSATQFGTLDGEHIIGFNKLDFQTDAQGKVTGFVFHLNDGSGKYNDFTFTRSN